jgi:hypothetical protein
VTSRQMSPLPSLRDHGPSITFGRRRRSNGRRLIALGAVIGGGVLTLSALPPATAAGDLPLAAAGGPEPAVAPPAADAAAAEPVGEPAPPAAPPPAVFAEIAGVDLHLPSEDVLLVGFHEAALPGALPLTPKFIFVTGGVSSALGKGITAASLGRLLKARGLRVTMQKLDPYINVDPGTMNPFEHGEVFVTDDGGETDLDLGHYERFIDESLHRGSSVSSGQIWLSVINKERRGDYLGKTVQVIPHITNEIKERIHAVAEDVDVVITEVGGTVGDIEGLPFLEAIRQLRYDVGRDNICYVHCALVPFIAAAGELKTKPAQHSVRELRSIGIQPDVLVLRSDREHRRRPAPQGRDAVRRRPRGRRRRRGPREPVRGPARDARGGPRHGRRPAARACPTSNRTCTSGRRSSERVQRPARRVTIAIVGKYVELPDAYLSVVEALRHAGIAHGVEHRHRLGVRPTTSPDDTVEARLAGASTGSSCPAGSASAGRGQDPRGPSTAASTRCRTSGSASGCRRPASSSPQRVGLTYAATPRSSSRPAPTPSST